MAIYKLDVDKRFGQYHLRLTPQGAAPGDFSAPLPDMNALIRSQANVGALTAAFVAANPGLAPDMLRVNQTPLGWLEQVQICLDRGYRPKSCPSDIGGASDDSRLRIWPMRQASDR